MKLLILILLFPIVLCAYLMWRNEKVYAYRTGILDQTFNAMRSDLLAGKEYVWRRDAYLSVSYDEMMWKFWKPLDSFYPDKSFLE